MIRNIRVRVLLGALVATGLACASLRPGDDGREIRVLVYNIHAGKDAKGVDNLARVAELVRSTRADIALLQEVDRGTTRSGKADQPALLASLTGFNVAFGKTLDYQGGDYGIAVLSRWPISADSLIRLPVVPPQNRSGVSHEPRGALSALIQVPGGTVEVLNTHIDASREDFYRRQEMTTLLQLATRSIRDQRRSTLVGGDLNAEPGSAVIDMIRGSVLRDPWPECGQGAGLSFPASAPVKRIDYLLLPADWRCVSATVLETDASDHLPVLFVLTRAR
ncbi:MAG TPA: endonuclease/exonuclease/phosphatase family protein [Gemmatimonadaceae bacterium]|nr:endonuclease/exonuclease/phosphatase family protein [Gemmatimonadaceae bacterium]